METINYPKSEKLVASFGKAKNVGKKVKKIKHEFSLKLHFR